MEVRGKVAIVTGASAGIGLATARLFAARGAKVALAARSRDKLERLAAELPDALAVQTDVTREEDVREMVATTAAHFGRLDILVNNAGLGYDAPVEKADVATVRHVFELDVVGPLVAMQAAIPLMRAQGGGAIVNVSSGLALMYLPTMGPYGAIKRALAHISLTAREELKADHIAVSVVYPYMTRTDFEAHTIKDVPEGAGGEEGGGPFHPPDEPEYVAEKILEAIEGGAAEVFAHEWIKGGA